ncbi:cilia- and flagella-associated protein 299 isoform X2 [Syngnathoides biaculeatus]|uniref:cilia- and flagella-associated protein 299 isoform X2 n=1 Tax=Syngnathoides biaculeatus TaxID=300417 RepID=UPI002ADE6AC2|nr:cilia- and flagella-associated protein 299 isoform X2 [Syngnathoides biaculeatus]
MESHETSDLRDPVNCFKDYEDYLDSKVTAMDLFFLKNKESARKLVEHGHKGTVLSLQEFEQRKAASPSASRYHQNQTTMLASSGYDIQDNFLRALAEREEANRMGKMTSLIFMRDANALGQEVSGYLDYAHRLQTQDFAPYFSGRKKLVPGPSDLWRKLDSKILNVDPKCDPGEDSRRTMVQSGLYSHVVILDHYITSV